MSGDRPRRKNATINDVAATAGVATGTVSRYLNGREVRSGNRLSIEKAIETLAFQRNAVARAMKSGTTNIVGVLVPTFDEFHAQIFNHLARLFRQSGRTMLTHCHDGDPAILTEAITFFVNQRVDAVVMAGSLGIAGPIQALVQREIPVVIYNNDVVIPHVDRVFVDNFNASQRAIDHLLEMGHRRIATVFGFMEESSGQQRRAGYEYALADRSIILRADYQHAGLWSAEGGYSAMETFMALDEPPTAVFSANYRMTIGILEWVRKHQRRVPHDVAVVSFDEVDWFPLYGGGITAIAQPLGRIAESIVNYVTSRLTDRDLPDIRSRILDCNIILRGSSAFRR